MRLKKGLLTSGLILLVLNLIASALNYICQILMARILDVDAFGTINTIFSFLLIVGVPGTALTMSTAKFIAENIDTPEKTICWSFWKTTTIVVGAFSIFLGGFCLFINKSLGFFLKIDSFFILILTFIIAALGYFHPFYSGILSGLKKFGFLGFYAIMIPIYKLIGIYICDKKIALMDRRLEILLIVIIMGSLVTALVGALYTYKELKPYKSKTNASLRIIGEMKIVDSLIVNMCLMFYMNIDLLAVRYLSDTNVSGLYSSVTLVGRIVYYCATTLGTVLLPNVAANKGKKAFKMLNNAMVCIMLVSLFALIPINFWGKEIINILYGSRYEMAVIYLIYVSIIAIALGLMTILVNYMVGIGEAGFAKCCLLIMVAVICFCIFCGATTKVVLLLIGLSGIMCVSIIYLHLAKEWR